MHDRKNTQYILSDKNKRKTNKTGNNRVQFYTSYNNFYMYIVYTFERDLNCLFR